MGKRTASPRVSTICQLWGWNQRFAPCKAWQSQPSFYHRHGKIASCYIFHRNDKPRDQDLRVQDALVIVVEPFYGNTVANARILCRPQELESEQFGNLRWGFTVSLEKCIVPIVPCFTLYYIILYIYIYIYVCVCVSNIIYILYPIGSMYGILMVTWIPSIYPLYVTINIPSICDIIYTNYISNIILYLILHCCHPMWRLSTRAPSSCQVELLLVFKNGLVRRNGTRTIKTRMKKWLLLSGSPYCVSHMRKCCWAHTPTSPSTPWNFHEIQLTATESRPCSSLQPPACQFPAGMWWEMWWNMVKCVQQMSDTSTETKEKPKLQVICRPCRWPLWLSVLSGLRQPQKEE